MTWCSRMTRTASRPRGPRWVRACGSRERRAEGTTMVTKKERQADARAQALGKIELAAREMHRASHALGMLRNRMNVSDWTWFSSEHRSQLFSDLSSRDLASWRAL